MQQDMTLAEALDVADAPRPQNAGGVEDWRLLRRALNALAAEVRLLQTQAEERDHVAWERSERD